MSGQSREEGSALTAQWSSRTFERPACSVENKTGSLQLHSIPAQHTHTLTSQQRAHLAPVWGYVEEQAAHNEAHDDHLRATATHTGTALCEWRTAYCSHHVLKTLANSCEASTAQLQHRTPPLPAAATAE